MAGAAISANTGRATATQRMWRASAVRNSTAGEDKSKIGSKAQADIDQSEVISTPITGAIRAGSRSGNQNASATRRRSGSAGHAMSASAAPLGRASANTQITGIAT